MAKINVRDLIRINVRDLIRVRDFTPGQTTELAEVVDNAKEIVSIFPMTVSFQTAPENFDTLRDADIAARIALGGYYGGSYISGGDHSRYKTVTATWVRVIYRGEL